ncbi:class I SAM-dependent methyltransferase [Clostridium estertheticum]|uniref:class I SAM-dependent methyltransferase n=1 Tax=Clostridium estertheticum TaxID=238834 RepID=UPI001C0D7768|nr:class I SAM-dependent methyltransferase [Clostridium estertheticum]MBU3176812.1 class I SAM-dependent methyltransferase [Clostridium estertheticum]
MKEIFKQIQLYRFIMFCNDTNMDKEVLDCGAGGDCPPLSLFLECGYLTHGVEFNTKQLEQSNIYSKKKEQNLNIEKGDMRQLKFEDESLSFVYSYNSVFHMTKADISKSISEMKRVLKPNGLLFVNFLSIKDSRCGQGIAVGENEYEQMDDFPVIHSYCEEYETDRYFHDMEILYKENRVLERIYEGEKIRQGFIDYIVKKTLLPF